MTNPNRPLIHNPLIGTESHEFAWIRNELDRWIEGQFFFFDIKLLNLRTMDEGVKSIRLTSNLICKLVITANLQDYSFLALNLCDRTLFNIVFNINPTL